MPQESEPRISRRQFVKVAVGGSLLGGLLAAGGYRYVSKIEPAWVQVTRVPVPIDGLSPALDGLTIAHLSDLHASQYTTLDQIGETVCWCNALKPDVVAITGDFAWHDLNLIGPLSKVLASLKAPLGVHTILGNHDLWTDASLVTRSLADQRLEPLVNRGRLLSVGESQIYLAGLDDAWCGAPDLDLALGSCPEDVPAILLLHEPDPADDMAGDPRLVLQLSGHSHGGQVRLPLLDAPILPYLASHYPSGLYKVGNMWLYTNRGIGTSGIHVRLNCRPEITLLTLQSA